MVWLYFIVRMLFATICSPLLSNLILFTPYATSCIRLLEKRKSRKCSAFAMGRQFILDCFVFSGMTSPTHFDCNFWALSLRYLEQLKVFMISSLVCFSWPTKDIMIDFPKESLSACIEVKTFKSSGMSSSSLSLDNWSFKTVWINSSDCPGAIASANFFSSCCLNWMNLPFKSCLVFSLNSSNFFCLIWYWIGLAYQRSLRELPLAFAFSITSLDNMISSGW